VLRKRFELCVGAPAMDATAVINKGPNIHGMGVPSQTHNSAANPAAAKVPRVRSLNFKRAPRHR
jgi:hypothetical protein